MFRGNRELRRRNLAATVSVVALSAGMLASLVIGQLTLGAAPAPPGDAGPLTGDQARFKQEQSCSAELVKNESDHRLNHWPAIGSAEHSDSLHTGMEPCATFTGSFDGANQVFQHASDTTFSQINFVVFDGPDGAYLMGGGTASPPSAGSYVARFDPASGARIWQTQLQSLATSGQWLAFGSLAIHKNGYLIAAAGPSIFKIDRSNGHIVASEQQPILAGGPTNVNFDGMQFAPDAAGTILLKTQTRPIGCPTQGNGAMVSCQADYGPQPNTTVIAADPDTLENIDAIELDQEVTARPIVTTHKGKIYIYLAGTTTLQRIIWNPETRKLQVDESWAPEYLLEGQTVGDAPALLGDWVVANTNAAGGKVPISIVAVNQDDPTRLMRLNPWGDGLPEGVRASESPASFGVDPDNSMIFAQDWIVSGVFGVSLDQSSGTMEVAWSRPDWRTSGYFSLVGPPDQRVLISQYISPDFRLRQVKAGLTYTESVLWADALTGETIAQSGYNASTAPGSLVNVGYGGRIYTMGNNGTIYIYQVEEA